VHQLAEIACKCGAGRFGSDVRRWRACPKTSKCPYRERKHQEEVSRILRGSVRKVTYALPLAGKHLARILDKLDIL